MEIILVVIVVVLVIVLAFILLGRPQGSNVDLLKTDLVELNRSISELQTNLGDKLDKNQRSMASSLTEQLRESTKIVADVTQKLTKLDETNKRVVDVADELKTLQNVLQNPKQRGTFGEYYLETVLGNVLPTKNYQMQYKFKSGIAVDAVIFLDKGQILPIDSKFSLENYNRMVGSQSKPERDELFKRVQSDLKNRIDETSKYILPNENTMDFAFMFIPSESLYYDLLIGNVSTGAAARDLVEYAFREKHVIIVSPTTFVAYLQTVLQGLRGLQIEQQAKDIQKQVGSLGTHIARFDEYMQKLGGTLATTVNHYNNAHKELAKVDKDVMKITGSDSAIEPLLVDKPSDE